MMYDVPDESHTGLTHDIPDIGNIRPVLRTPEWDVVVLTDEEPASRNGVYRLTRETDT